MSKPRSSVTHLQNIDIEELQTNMAEDGSDTHTSMNETMLGKDLEEDNTKRGLRKVKRYFPSEQTLFVLHVEKVQLR
ncbi:hypothetical protein M0804_004444 [Polistes exclamans]|nr:hypothetical protein M0804_004444 [Polistes exclamans]